MARIITFIIFGGFGFVMLYVGVTQYFQQRRSLINAERVDAVITYSEVFKSVSADTDNRLGRSNSTTSYRADVKFRYRVGGEEYESDLMYPTIIITSSASREAAEAELAPFPVGAKVRAYVDPSHPEQAFLIASKKAGPMVFMILGLLLPPLAWWVGKYV
jgi:hypothetical protein